MQDFEGALISLQGRPPLTLFLFSLPVAESAGILLTGLEGPMSTPSCTQWGRTEQEDPVCLGEKGPTHPRDLLPEKKFNCKDGFLLKLPHMHEYTHEHIDTHADTHALTPTLPSKLFFLTLGCFAMSLHLHPVLQDVLQIGET